MSPGRRFAESLNPANWWRKIKDFFARMKGFFFHEPDFSSELSEFSAIKHHLDYKKQDARKMAYTANRSKIINWVLRGAGLTLLFLGIAAAFYVHFHKEKEVEVIEKQPVVQQTSCCIQTCGCDCNEPYVEEPQSTAVTTEGEAIIQELENSLNDISPNISDDWKKTNVYKDTKAIGDFVKGMIGSGQQFLCDTSFGEFKQDYEWYQAPKSYSSNHNWNEDSAYVQKSKTNQYIQRRTEACTNKKYKKPEKIYCDADGNGTTIEEYKENIEHFTKPESYPTEHNWNELSKFVESDEVEQFYMRQEYACEKGEFRPMPEWPEAEDEPNPESQQKPVENKAESDESSPTSESKPTPASEKKPKNDSKKQPAQAQDDTANTSIDTPVDIDVTKNDTGSGLSVTSATAENGTVTKNPNGTLKFSPAPGFTGTGKIDYTVQAKNGTTSSAQVGINVSSVTTKQTGVTNNNTCYVRVCSCNCCSQQSK